MTDDYQSHFNSPDAMDLAGYRQFMSDALNASPELRHEIQYVVAENDIVVLKMTNGKIVEEWVVFDFAEFVFLQGEQSQDILLRAQLERLRRT